MKQPSPERPRERDASDDSGPLDDLLAVVEVWTIGTALFIACLVVLLIARAL